MPKKKEGKGQKGHRPPSIDRATPDSGAQVNPGFERSPPYQPGGYMYPSPERDYPESYPGELRGQGYPSNMDRYPYQAQMGPSDMEMMELRQRRVSDISYHSDTNGPSRGPSHRSVPNMQPNDLMEELPSRQLGIETVVAAHGAAKTIRARGKSRKRLNRIGTVRLRPGQELDLQDVADGLLQDEEFINEPEELQQEEIRDLPIRLSEKVTLKKKVRQASVRAAPKRPGACTQCGYSIALNWKHFKENLAEVMYSLELWKGHFKTIEGNFGSGVLSYFLFIKLLLFTNLPLFLIPLGFVIIPQLLYRYIRRVPKGYSGSFCPESLLTGDCWLNQTELYYGSYYNGTFAIITSQPYNMQFAYLLTMVAYYVVTLIVVMTRLSVSYKKNYVEASGASDFQYVHRIFCGWDYNVTVKEAVELKHKSILNELREYIMAYRKDKEDRTCQQWCGIIFLRLFTNVMVLVILAASGYVVWYISVTQSLRTDVPVLGAVVLPLIISAINFVVPFAFSILASFEQYKAQKTELYITMVRTILLNGATIGALVFFWFRSVSCGDIDPLDKEIHDQGVQCKECWETFMGVQIYRLVIMDFIFILIFTFISEFIRGIMSKLCCRSLGHPEFNIARNTLNLIYSQALCWLGTFYSPMMSVIMVIKLLVIFYVKRVSVVMNCVPSKRPWRAGRTHSVIQLLLVLAYLLCFGAVVYSVYSIKPSETCGPYQGYNNTWQIISDNFSRWQDQTSFIRDLLEVLFSLGFLILVVVMLGIITHYIRMISSGHDEVVELLKHQLSLESKDKQFLLQQLQQKRSNYKGATRDNTRAQYSPARDYNNGPTGLNIITTQAEIIRERTPSPHSPERQPTPYQTLPPGDRTPDSLHDPHPCTSAYNPGYLDSSIEAREIQAAVSNNPNYLDATPQRQSGEITNPGYRDSSPTLRPQLPYGTSQYSPVHTAR